LIRPGALATTSGGRPNTEANEMRATALTLGWSVVTI
jgi:hypothetical protein